ncbi:MAG: glycosyltransferase, partial [Gemmatimonadaceae bacterium]
MTSGNSAPLTVLHIDTERGWRGGERQALWLATGLERLGHHSLVAARPGDPLAIRAARNGLRVIPCAPASEADALAAFMLRRTVTNEGVQIVHAHTAHAVALASLSILLTPAKMVGTRRVDFPLRRNLGTLWKYRRAHAIIAISRAVADVLAKSGIDRARIEVVSSGVDLNRAVQPASRDELAELGIPNDSPFAILVAALVPHK